MAVGLTEPSELLAVDGVELATTAAELRYREREDLLLITIAEGANTAAVFTKNHYCAAPVLLAREYLSATAPRAMIINSGNANAGTGAKGMENARLSSAQVADLLGIEAQQVLPFSTGVIGEQMPMEKFAGGVKQLKNNLSADNWMAAARAIMTTDTLPKAVSEQLEVDGKPVIITGIAKGSGMICPNMATMLSYIATDADISAGSIQAILDKITAASFNRITVDSDTSTNDALVLVATGKSGVTVNQHDGFYQALERVAIQLATSVIRDGEGASKFVKVAVNNAESESDAREIAFSVAHSPLVKTALFASDPNWGRILMAVGKANVERLNTELIDISINGEALIEAGEPAATYSEALGKSIFTQAEIEITIDLNCAKPAGDFHVWTSDLSHDYVSINADYRS